MVKVPTILRTARHKAKLDPELTLFIHSASRASVDHAKFAEHS